MKIFYSIVLYCLSVLSQARAKLELRVEATESDALDVIDVLRYAMRDTSEANCVRPGSSSDGKLTNTKVSLYIVSTVIFLFNISYEICGNLHEITFDVI